MIISNIIAVIFIAAMVYGGYKICKSFAYWIRNIGKAEMMRDYLGY